MSAPRNTSVGPGERHPAAVARGANFIDFIDDFGREWTRAERYRAAIKERDALAAQMAAMRLALEDAIIPLAVIVLGEASEPYIEHGPDLKEQIQKAHDSVLAALTKLSPRL